MTSVILQTISVLLPISMVFSLNYEVELIDRLNDFYNFDHNLFFLDDKTDSSRYISSKTATSLPKTIYVFDDSYLESSKVTLLEHRPATTSKNNFLIVVARDLQLGIMSRLLMRIVEICQLEKNVKIGLFFTNASIDSVEKLLQWSGSVGIGNIFCAFYTESFNVFRFNPFGKFELINVTSESVQNYFPNNLPNYHKYPLRLALVDGWDVRYHDVKFWDTVADVINASKLVISVAEVDTETNRSIGADLLLHISNKANLNKLYPCRMELAVIVVPHAKPYSSFVEYLTSGAWKRLLVYTFIVIVMSSIVLILSGWLQNKKILLFETISDILNLLMNDNSAIRYGQRNRADIFVIVPITFTGLIVVNGVFSLFQSYLTLPMYERQINSLTDLFKSSVMILTNGIFWADWTIDTLESITDCAGWSAKVARTDFPNLRYEYSRFNDSVAYIGTGHDAQAFVMAQKRLDLKAYHIIEQAIARVPFSYKELKDLSIIGRLNEIVHLFQSAGFLEKWIEDEQLKLVTEIYNANIQLKTSDNSSIDSTFTIPSLVWFGWASSAIVFICEILWNRIKNVASQCRECLRRLKRLPRIRRRKICCK